MEFTQYLGSHVCFYIFGYKRRMKKIYCYNLVEEFGKVESIQEKEKANANYHKIITRKKSWFHDIKRMF